ncbi:MAG: GDSL-type esterase/lipase family protein [Bacteroidales bacterium]|nr:GDSL-type esterase/lipase family protein [Lachnoclostridium sp.]MCM1383438.1 GDSL-type esterase/lipase family protein [Lachnoclostridium sp.]MCM1464287.1 GDSL-type esterase/lipase family protein [Bacteroidales bacterium]
MKRKISRQIMIYDIIAAVCFLGCLFVGMPSREPKEERGNILILGDSIVGICRDDTSVTAIMSELLGEPVYNGALGGTCYSYADADMRLAYTKDCFNLAGLSQALYTGDFRPQQHARVRESATEYFEDVIYDLSTMKLNDIHTVILVYGVNDYHDAVALSNPEDLYDPYTFEGAMRSSVRYLKKAMPQSRIILVTPLYSWYPPLGLTCENYDTGNGFLEDYVNAEMVMAKELDLEVIDLYHDFYKHDNYEDWKTYTVDGLHPNETGRSMIARALTDYLQDL